MEVSEKVDVAQFESLLKAKPALMVYFFQEKCGVCTATKNNHRNAGKRS